MCRDLEFFDEDDHDDIAQEDLKGLVGELHVLGIVRRWQDPIHLVDDGVVLGVVILAVAPDVEVHLALLRCPVPGVVVLQRAMWLPAAAAVRDKPQVGHTGTYLGKPRACLFLQDRPHVEARVSQLLLCHRHHMWQPKHYIHVHGESLATLGPEAVGVLGVAGGGHTLGHQFRTVGHWVVLVNYMLLLFLVCLQAGKSRIGYHLGHHGSLKGELAYLVAIDRCLHTAPHVDVGHGPPLGVEPQRNQTCVGGAGGAAIVIPGDDVRIALACCFENAECHDNAIVVFVVDQAREGGVYIPRRGVHDAFHLRQILEAGLRRPPVLVAIEDLGPTGAGNQHERSSADAV